MNHLTGRQEYISPNTNRHIVDSLLESNAAENERILGKQCKWEIEHDDLYEELRLDAEEMAIWLMQRISQFARFRIRNEKGNKSRKLHATVQDINDAYNAVQMERQKQ